MKIAYNSAYIQIETDNNKVDVIELLPRHLNIMGQLIIKDMTFWIVAVVFDLVLVTYH